MLRVKAYAKINLSLKILGRRPDGYHEIDSLMQSVSLCDFLSLTPIDEGVQLTTNNLRLTTDGKNLAYKAAEVFIGAMRTGAGEPSKGVKIFLEKNIPLAAGLAGGSADAAAVIYGLNQLITPDSRFSTPDLLKIAAEIGSDVPFCLVGGSCTVKGRGEIVKRNAISVIRNYVIVTPEIEVSSKWAYEEWDRLSNVQGPKSQGRNDLEPVVIKKYQVIQKIKDKLLSLGCSYAQMSGSGPSVFGIAPDLSRSEQIAAEMKKEFARAFAVYSVDRGVETVAA